MCFKLGKVTIVALITLGALALVRRVDHHRARLELLQRRPKIYEVQNVLKSVYDGITPKSL